MPRGTRAYMKKLIPIIIIILIFLVGIGFLCYPLISSVLNNIGSRSEAEENIKKAASMDADEIDKLFAEADLYNRNLVNTVILTDPFDPDTYAKIGARYRETFDVDGKGLIGYVTIPKINVYLPIFHGTSKEVLDKGAGHLDNTSFPVGGESTHSVISAHTGFPTETFFDYLVDLKEGDEFFIRVLNRTLKYEVDQIKVITPDDTSDLHIIDGKDHVTLLTCTPYGLNTHRLIVRGKRVEYDEKADTSVSGVAVDNGFIYLFGYRVSFLSMGLFIAVFVAVVSGIVILIIRRNKQLKASSPKKEGE